MLPLGRRLYAFRMHPNAWEGHARKPPQPGFPLRRPGLRRGVCAPQALAEVPQPPLSAASLGPPPTGSRPAPGLPPLRHAVSACPPTRALPACHPEPLIPLGVRDLLFSAKKRQAGSSTSPLDYARDWLGMTNEGKTGLGRAGACPLPQQGTRPCPTQASE